VPEVVAGAEPFSAAGGAAGVLVLHGFTGSPHSMRPLAEAFAAAGFTVELPRLPGHGTTVEDMAGYRFDDWVAAAEAAYADLAARCEQVVVAGLSMGGTLALRLAADHPDLAGAVLVNPLVDVTTEGTRGMREGLQAAPEPYVPGIGSDIAAEGVEEGAYPLVPVAGLLSLLDGAAALMPRLPELRPPLLLLSSPQDHVVEPASADHLEAHAGSPVRRVLLTRSFHVATLDLDADLVEREAVAFAQEVTA
jgi:carboxylesterase